MYTSPYLKITLDQAISKIIEKGYRFECYTTLEEDRWMNGRTIFKESLLGVTKGNGVWHWFKIDESSANYYDMKIYGDELEYLRSYSQNTGATFKRNQDYVRTAVNLLTK